MSRTVQKTKKSGRECDEDPMSIRETTIDGMCLSQDEERHALTGEDVSALLYKALLQAVKVTLSSLPQSAFPISSSTFYTGYIQPARPYQTSDTGTPIDIKHSGFKSLAAFLKKSEKQGILKLKSVHGDVHIIGVNAEHEDVRAHVVQRTVGDTVGVRRKEKEQKPTSKLIVAVTELWKPTQPTMKIFSTVGSSASELYTHPQIWTTVNRYAKRNRLFSVNDGDDQLIDVYADPILRGILRGQTDTISASSYGPMSSRELTGALCKRMQAWHRLELEDGYKNIIKEGKPPRIRIAEKQLGPNRPCTIVTGHEMFIRSTDLAEGLRSWCSSATSVSPDPREYGDQVMIPGRQSKAVLEYVLQRKVPKAWIANAESIENMDSHERKGGESKRREDIYLDEDRDERMEMRRKAKDKKYSRLNKHKY